MKHHLLAPTIAILFLIQLASVANPQSIEFSTLVKDYLEIYNRQFKLSKPELIPLNRGSVNYRVGDVWDPTLTRLLESTDVCFPGLTFRNHADTIGDITLKREASVGFLLRVEQLLSLAGSGDDDVSINVNFIDVMESIPSEGEVRQRYDASKCPIANPIINKDTAKLDGDVPVIIGRLYTGKRQITITYGSKAESEAKLEQLGKLVAGVPVEVGANAKITSGKSIVIADRDNVPLAFAPAFVPVLSASMGGGGDTRYVWTPFDPNNPAQKDAIDELEAMVDSGTWK